MILNRQVLTVNRLYRFLGHTVLLLGVLFSGHSIGHGQATEALVERLRSRYNSVDLLRAEFVQRTTSPFGETMPINTGVLIIEGDNYRAETDVQTFVTNGETTWVYDSFQNQVLVNDYVRDESTFIISDFLDNFHNDYEIPESSFTYINGVKHYRLLLIPKDDNAFFKEVTLTVRDSDDVIQRLNVTDVNDAILDFELDKVEINPPLEGDPFTFIPPEDAEVIDLRL